MADDEATTETPRAVVARHRRAADRLPLARALYHLGHAGLARREDAQAEAAEAIAAWQEAASLLRPVMRAPADQDLFIELLIHLGGLLCCEQSGRMAAEPLEEAADILHAAGDATPRFVWTLNLLAAARQMQGHTEAALAVLIEAESTARAVARASRTAEDAAGWAMVLNNLGRAELALGRPRSARRTLEACGAVTRELVAARGAPDDRTLHAAVTNRHGHALEQTGEKAAALACHGEAVAIMRALVGAGRVDLAEDLAGVEADWARLEAAMSMPSSRPPP
jgi:tetratricopeptide (TPR) repeat protein